MQDKKTGKLPFGSLASPYVIIGAALILALVVVLLAVFNYRREERIMTQILSEKGAGLIKAFEAGTRTGMMGMLGGEARIQTLLEETARQDDILYIAVIDPRGRILAHSDRERIGQSFPFPSKGEMHSSEEIRWRIVEQEERRAFEVSRRFVPLRKQHHMFRGRTHQGRNFLRFDGNRWPEDCLPGSDQQSGTGPMIYLGMDVVPFEQARSGDLRNSLIMTGTLVLLGFGGMVSLFWAQSSRVSRRLLQDARAFSSEVMTSLPVGLMVTDRDGRLTYVNGPAESISRRKRGEVIGRSAMEVLPRELIQIQERLTRGETVLEEETEILSHAGDSLPVSVSAAVMRTDEGDFVGYLFILRDLREVRQLQSEVRKREKLAAVGNLAAGVAHEIRNPLSSIKGFATYLENRFPQGSTDRQAATTMVQEVDRLNRVITELLEFARPTDIQTRPSALESLVDHSLRLVDQDAETRKVRIERELAPDLPMVDVDPDRITQALLNIYINGIQSMDKGGTLMVRTLPGPNGFVRLEVEDTGGGIPREDMDKVFDPYFTTKPSGTGLGLAIVLKIVESHGGKVDIRSLPGQGAVISLLLPEAEIDSAEEKND
ncbi:MAG: ATP-binding protein [Desulfovibrionales bacterium]